jgi:hypothetical protein
VANILLDQLLERLLEQDMHFICRLAKAFPDEVIVPRRPHPLVRIKETGHQKRGDSFGAGTCGFERVAACLPASSAR